MTESQDSAVHAAISRRILLSVSGRGGELIRAYGLSRVIDAIDEESARVGEVEEIGSGDVSIWVDNISTSLSSQANNFISSSKSIL
jgi:hypothetical protein